MLPVNPVAIGGAGGLFREMTWEMSFGGVEVSQIAPPSQKAKLPTTELSGTALGIDLGLKDLMAGSDCSKVEAQQFYRDVEPALASAQRAGKKARTKAIHARSRTKGRVASTNSQRAW